MWLKVHNCGSNSINVDQSPQMWTKVHKCGPKSTNVDQSRWTSVHMNDCSVNAEHVQSGSLSLASISKYIILSSYFECFFNSRAKYVHEHTSALPFLHMNHNRPLPAEQGLTPGINAHLLHSYLMPLEVFYQTQIIIMPCMYFWLFPWQPTLCSICYYFYTWGVLQEVDIISKVRPYGKITTYIYCLCHLLFYCLP